MHVHLPYFGRIANGANARGMNAVSRIKRLSGNPLPYLTGLTSGEGLSQSSFLPRSQSSNDNYIPVPWKLQLTLYKFLKIYKILLYRSRRLFRVAIIWQSSNYK